MRLLPMAMAALIAVSSVVISKPAKAEDPLVASICDYVKANDKNRLRKKLTENRVKLRNVYGSVLCSGNSLLRTAYMSKADDVGEFIAKRLSTTELNAAESDGSTIMKWAEGNGYGASAISTAIKERLGGNGGEEE